MILGVKRPKTFKEPQGSTTSWSACLALKPLPNSSKWYNNTEDNYIIGTDYRFGDDSDPTASLCMGIERSCGENERELLLLVYNEDSK